MKHLIYILLGAAFLTFSCNKKKFFDGPNSYEDGFEAYTTIEDVQDGNNELWSYFQQTRDENKLTIDTTLYHSGGKSFRSYAVSSSDELGASKASINKQFMAFWDGEIVEMEAWYYIHGTDEANWLFLFDIEEKVNIGAGPGMRLALVNNQIRFEHKFLNPDIKQDTATAIDFPRNQWVKINVELKLSQKEEGYAKVWQDDVLILDQDNWQTLPRDFLYANQGSKGMYSQIEFGVTANTKENPMTVNVDDIRIGIKE